MARAAAVGAAWGFLLHRADVVSAPAGDGVGTAAPVAEALAYFHGIASFPRVLRSLGPPRVCQQLSHCKLINTRFAVPNFMA